MRDVLKLTAIGIFAGFVLILVLKIVMFATGNMAYVLLFNFEYIPVVNELEPVWLFGYVFHYLTCIISAIALFYILQIWNFQKIICPYIAVYTIGGGVLFFLTSLSNQPPDVNDVMAWIYWTVAHGIFGYVVGAFVKKWL